MQPPLTGSEVAGEEYLCGTERWVKIVPWMWTKRARGMWVGVERKGEEEGGKGGEGWWPDVGVWKVGLWLEEATLVFGEPEILEGR